MLAGITLAAYSAPDLVTTGHNGDEFPECIDALLLKQPFVCGLSRLMRPQTGRAGRLSDTRAAQDAYDTGGALTTRGPYPPLGGRCKRFAEGLQ